MKKLLMPVEEAAAILDKYVIDANITLHSFGFRQVRDIIIGALVFELHGWGGLGIALAAFIALYICDLFFGPAASVIKQEKETKEEEKNMTPQEFEDRANEYISNIAELFKMDYTPKNEDDIIQAAKTEEHNNPRLL